MAIGQDQIVTITADGVTVTDFAGDAVEVEPFDVAWDASAAEKGGWSSFMRKEVSEQPEAVANTLRGRVSEGRVQIPELASFGDEELRGIRRITVIACGTAAYAGMVAKYAIEQWARVPVEVELSHEFRYREPVLDDDTLVVSISQSGETMDTLMAVKYAREMGARTISICNTQGATIPRESDAVVYTHAGPEVAVASTKAFVAQIAALYLFGLHLARVRGTLTEGELAAQLAELQAVPEKIADGARAGRARRSSSRTGWPTPARCSSSAATSAIPIALEGALKLKELAYIHAEGFAAGELKHGPIALIEPGQPVFVIVPSPRGSANAAPQGRLEHPGDPRPRRPRHRDRRSGRRGGAAVRRRGAAHPARRHRCSSRSWRWCRCRCSRWSSRGEGPRRRPAAQPRQVRDGGVTKGLEAP